MVRFRLLTLKFEGRGENPLATDDLQFGRFLTWICGPNGSGKTPVMRGLIRAMGFPAPLAPDIESRTEGVWLAFVSAEENCKVFRRSTQDFFMRVEADASSVDEFRAEKQASAWILPRMGIEPRVLKGKDGGEVHPYASVVFPAFWVDQDLGWATTYASPASFIQEQAEEVTRWMLGLRTKNSPDVERAYEESKRKAKWLADSLKSERELAKTLRSSTPRSDVRQLDHFRARREELGRQLEQQKSAFNDLGATFAGIDEEIRRADEKMAILNREVGAIDARRDRLAATAREINAQIEMVGSNEVAALAFRALCGSETCRFFTTPEESYGRRLLYLKDQLKDLQVSRGLLSQEREALCTENADVGREAARLREERKRLAATPSFQKTAAAIETVATRLAEMSVRIARAEQLQKCDERVAGLLDRKNAADEAMKELKPKGTRRADERALDARKNLAVSMEEWLTVLQTPNLRGAVLFDEQLRLVIGDERFGASASYSGSTRTRIILAYHAALLEVSLAMRGEHPRLLLLDAPKQHELHAEHLWAYVEQLRKVANRTAGFQVVITSTEEPGPMLDTDMVWRPPYHGGARFLG